MLRRIGNWVNHNEIKNSSESTSKQSKTKSKGNGIKLQGKYIPMFKAFKREKRSIHITTQLIGKLYLALIGMYDPKHKRTNKEKDHHYDNLKVIEEVGGHKV